MTTIVNLDFRNAPPATGGGGSDYIPPADYRFIVAKSSLQKTKASKDMIVLNVTVEGGDFDGSRLAERFVLPASEDDSQFPLQRFHAFLNSVGAFPGEKRVPLDIDKLVNQRFLGTVDDDWLEPLPNSNKPAKKISRIVDFIAREQKAAPATNGSAPNGAVPKAATKPAAAPAPVTAPAAEAPFDLDDEEPIATLDIGEETEEAPVAEAPVAAAPTPRRRAAPAPAPTSIETEIDDLFS